jgi:hypothetical protein
MIIYYLRIINILIIYIYIYIFFVSIPSIRWVPDPDPGVVGGFI